MPCTYTGLHEVHGGHDIVIRLVVDQCFVHGAEEHLAYLRLHHKGGNGCGNLQNEDQEQADTVLNEGEGGGSKLQLDLTSSYLLLTRLMTMTLSLTAP